MRYSCGKTDITAPIFCAWTRLEALAQRHIFGRIGVSASGFKILALLARRPSMTPSEMLAELEVTKSNLSQRLRVLEEKHLVKRSAVGKNDDQRKTPFLITPAGKKKLGEAAIVAKKAGLSFEKDFTREEIRNHIAFFSKLIRILDQKEIELNAPPRKNTFQK